MRVAGGPSLPCGSAPAPESPERWPMPAVPGTTQQLSKPLAAPASHSAMAIDEPKLAIRSASFPPAYSAESGPPVRFGNISGIDPRLGLVPTSPFERAAMAAKTFNLSEMQSSVPRCSVLDGETKQRSQKRIASESARDACQKIRRTSFGTSFPSVSDLASFAGLTTSSPRTPPSSRTTLSHTRSMPELAAANKNKQKDPPWKRFQRWKAQNPNATRTECREFVQKVLQI